MSVFGTLMSKIFHHGGAGASPSATASTSSAPTSPNVASTSVPPPAAAAPTAAGSTVATAAPAATSSQTSAPSASRGSSNSPQVDVEAVLNDLAQKNGQKLNWRTSIVDLMKLVGMDSSLDARKELAHELGYVGDTNDSAAMNVWLHKQVMKKLEENGGKVPADLKD